MSENILDKKSLIDIIDKELSHLKDERALPIWSKWALFTTAVYLIYFILKDLEVLVNNFQSISYILLVFYFLFTITHSLKYLLNLNIDDNYNDVKGRWADTNYFIYNLFLTLFASMIFIPLDIAKHLYFWLYILTYISSSVVLILLFSDSLFLLRAKSKLGITPSNFFKKTHSITVLVFSTFSYIVFLYISVKSFDSVDSELFIISGAIVLFFIVLRVLTLSNYLEYVYKKLLKTRRLLQYTDADVNQYYNEIKLLVIGISMNERIKEILKYHDRVNDTLINFKKEIQEYKLPITQPSELSRRERWKKLENFRELTAGYNAQLQKHNARINKILEQSSESLQHVNTMASIDNLLIVINGLKETKSYIEDLLSDLESGDLEKEYAEKLGFDE